MHFTPVATRRRVRRFGRAVRRVTTAGAHLGPAAPTAFTMRRLRGQRLTEPVNTSLTWVIADNDRTTRLWVHHYWADAYGGIDPALSAQLIDLDGRTVAAWSVEVPPHGLRVIDIAEQCAASGIPLPFEGQILLRAEHEGLVAGRPVQVFGEYRGGVGASGVHGQYGLQIKPASQLISGMRVDPSSSSRSAVVVVNAYDGTPRGASKKSTLRLYNANGESRSVRLAEIEHRASRRVYVDELFDDVGGFLGDRPGHLVVSVACPSSRLLNLVEYDDGRCIVNHGTVDRLFDQGPGVEFAGTVPTQPVTSLPVWCDDVRETIVTLPNRWGPLANDYSVTIDVFDLSGLHRATLVEMVPSNGLRVVRIGEALRREGIEESFRGHAEVRVAPNGAVDEWSAWVDMIVGFEDRGLLAGEVQVGSDFFNCDSDHGLPEPLIRRTRVTGRVASGEGLIAWLFVAHPVASTPEARCDRRDSMPSAAVTLTLLDSEGRERAMKTVDLPAHGGLCAAVRDLWPELDALLAPVGTGTVRVRSTEARLYGYSWIEEPDSLTFPICHLIGG